jgi:hypothetical protein
VAARDGAALRPLVQARGGSDGEPDGRSFPPRPALVAGPIPQPRGICLTRTRWPLLQSWWFAPAARLGMAAGTPCCTAVRWQPSQAIRHDDYLHLVALADVALDTPHTCPAGQDRPTSRGYDFGRLAASDRIDPRRGLGSICLKEPHVGSVGAGLWRPQVGANIVLMASSLLLSTTSYECLEPHPGSFYRELFVRGLSLRASRLIAWMEAEGLTPEQAAADRGLPVEAVLEAMDYVQSHASVIADDLEREHQLLRERDLLETGNP